MKKLIILSLFFTLFFPSWVFSNSVFVQSPIAKLLSEPNIASAGKLLKAGTELQQIGEQDMFIKVKSGSESGWVMKLYVSKVPPSNKASNRESREVNCGSV
ncbi:MAG: hypothetical protein IPL26_06885 [Leptospiraceae bacterium]|nr:hypothetical protein [Leptospiraceae bacterium]